MPATELQVMKDVPMLVFMPFPLALFFRDYFLNMPSLQHLPSLFTPELHVQPSVPGLTSALASALPYLP